MRSAGARFRNDIVDGMGGKQVLVDEPSGNWVDLLSPETELSAVIRPPAFGIAALEVAYLRPHEPRYA
jgi:hypothetical protein